MPELPESKNLGMDFLAELALPLLGGNKNLNSGQTKIIKYLIY